jgi:hypothetical protein
MHTMGKANCFEAVAGRVGQVDLTCYGWALSHFVNGTPRSFSITGGELAIEAFTLAVGNLTGANSVRKLKRCGRERSGA